MGKYIEVIKTNCKSTNFKINIFTSIYLLLYNMEMDSKKSKQNIGSVYAYA